MRLGKPGDRIEQEQHVQALIPEMFCGRHGAIGCAFLGTGRFAGGCGDNDRLRHDRFRKNVADELVHLTAAFADQGDDHPVGIHSGCQ